MDPKISFRALARKCEVIFHRPSMTLSIFTLRFFGGKENLVDHDIIVLISIN